MNTKVRFALDCGVFLVGLGLGYALYQSICPKSETPAPAIRQADGSLILERRPATLEEAKPKQAIPKGGKVERIVQVTVEPKQRVSARNLVEDTGSSSSSVLGGSKGTTPATGFTNGSGSRQDSAGACPPVRVDLSLVRMKDKTRRVLASSPDGSVVGGIDVPIESAALAHEIRWNVQALAGYDRFRARRVSGGSVTYQRSFLAGSIGVIGETAFVGVGVRF